MQQQLNLASVFHLLKYFQRLCIMLIIALSTAQCSAVLVLNSTLRDNKRFRIPNLRTESSSGLLTSISHFAPGSNPIYLFQFALRTPNNRNSNHDCRTSHRSSLHLLICTHSTHPAPGEVGKISPQWQVANRTHRHTRKYRPSCMIFECCQ